MNCLHSKRIVCLLFVMVFFLSYSSSGLAEVAPVTPDQDRSKISRKNNHQGVGFILLVYPNRTSIPIATAWAVEEKLLVTSGHVAQSILEAQKQALTFGVEIKVYIAFNQRSAKQYEVVAMTIHPKYREIKKHWYDQTTVVILDDIVSDYPDELSVPDAPITGSPDLAILEVNTRVPYVLKRAPKSILNNLHKGMTVQAIGFPLKAFRYRSYNDRVLATTHTGLLKSLSNKWYIADYGTDENIFIRHDLGATGASSGTPLFNESGQVVGSLWGEYVEMRSDKCRPGKLYARKNAITPMLGDAVRIDQLEEVLRLHKAK